MIITKSPKLVHCHLLLLTTLCLRSLKSATGDVCRAMKGSIPASDAFTWSVPLNPKRQSATFDVQVSNDFHVALVLDSNLIVPPAYTKYIVSFGAYSNKWCGIGSRRVSREFIKQLMLMAEVHTSIEPLFLFGDQWLYNGAVLNAYRTVALWLSWAGRVIAAGTGKVVGQNVLMSFIDPSPSPVNYMLIGGYNAAGNVTVNYCYDFLVLDRMIPIEQPTVTNSVPTVLECGRRCDQDPMCVGYSVVRDVLPVGKTACNVYYSVSGHQYDPQHVTYEYGNGTYPTY